MRFCRFDDDRYGWLHDNRVIDISDLVETLIASSKIPPFHDPFITVLDALASDLASDAAPPGGKPVADVRLLAPLRSPFKIVAAPVNYHAHVREMVESGLAGAAAALTDIGAAGLFLKASSSLVGPSEGIEIRFADRRTDYEVELVVVIGKVADNVARADALGFVAGYSLGIDVTTRGTEDRSFRKSSDSYSVLGPWLVTADEVPHPDRLDLTLHQNGALRQSASTADMVYDVARLIEFASSVYTLYPGDLIYTGTPQGVGQILIADTLVAASPAIGEMTVPVRARKKRRPLAP